MKKRKILRSAAGYEFYVGQIVSFEGHRAIVEGMSNKTDIKIKFTPPTYIYGMEDQGFSENRLYRHALIPDFVVNHWGEINGIQILHTRKI